MFLYNRLQLHITFVNKINVTLTQCYPYSDLPLTLPLLNVTLTQCYPYSNLPLMLPLLNVTLTQCYPYSMSPLLNVTLI